MVVTLSAHPAVLSSSYDEIPPFQQPTCTCVCVYGARACCCQCGMHVLFGKFYIYIYYFFLVRVHHDQFPGF